MKIKILLIILFMALSANAQYQDCIEPPSSYEFKSTSNQLKNEYTIPFAAKNLNTRNNNNYSNTKRKGLSGDDDEERPNYNPNDPGMVPVGDGVLIMTFFVIVYLILKKKNGNELAKNIS